MYSRILTSALLEESCGAKRPHRLMEGSPTIDINRPNISASKYVEEAVHANHPRLAKGGNYFGGSLGKVIPSLGSNAKSRSEAAEKIRTLRKERDFLRKPGEGDTHVQKYLQQGLANHYDNHSRLLSKLGDPLMMQAVPKSIDNLPSSPRVVRAAKK